MAELGLLVMTLLADKLGPTAAVPSNELSSVGRREVCKPRDTKED